MKRILVNLKDWLGYYENFDFSEQIDGLDITVFPSLPYLYLYKDVNVQVGSQNISSHEGGAHTGSVSAKHLKDFNVTSVLLNHKECKIIEKQKLYNKILCAQKAKMEVILCIDSYNEIELKKISGVLDTIKFNKIIIAYEPEQDLSISRISEELEFIQEYLAKYNLSYLYGNNVNSENLSLYIKNLKVDGFLISSHALDIKDLKTMVKLAKSED